MKTVSAFLKRPLVQASLVGAFGGMAPKLIELIPKLLSNNYPSAGQLLAFALLAFIGGVIVFVYKEENLQKALILGAGAPAIIATLTAQAVAPRQTEMVLPFSISFSSTAYAQTADATIPVRLLVEENQSPYRLNSLWIRADTTTLFTYTTEGDTVVFFLPPAAKKLRVDLPSQGIGLALPVSGIGRQIPIRIKIVNNQSVKDFWETFGNAKVPQYSIVMLE